MTEELKFNSLYDHYKESVGFLKQNLVKRDKLMIITLLLVTIYFFIELQPNQSVSVINTVIKAKFDFTLILNYEVLNSGSLFLIFLCLLNYYSLIVNIETQYEYLHKLEDDLNKIAGEKFIIRESAFYLKEYPLLSALIHRIYNLILPVLIIICMIYKIIQIISRITRVFSIFTLNIVIMILIIIITILFLLFVYRKNQKVQAVNKVVKGIFISLHLYKEEEENNNNPTNDESNENIAEQSNII